MAPAGKGQAGLEADARARIDAQLAAAGWVVQANMSSINPLWKAG